jgi:pimeloyl-ACP methyl ester carboxylesterase
VHQPEVARLTALVLALVVVAPVVCAGRTALLAGAFLIEFLTRARPPVLSALTDQPIRRPISIPLPGAGADLYVHRGLGAGRPLVLVHGFAPEGKDDLRVQDVAALLARAGFDVAVPTIPGLTAGRLGPEDVEPVIAALAARDGKAILIGASVGAGPALLAAATRGAASE